MLKQNVTAASLFAVLLLAGCIAAYQAVGFPLPDSPQEQHRTSSEDVEPNALPSDAFVGTAEGYGGELKVSVRMTEGRIVAVSVIEHEETPMFFERVYPALPEAITAKQSTDVDIVSGATRTSQAILKAVEQALEQAGWSGSQ